MTDAEIRLEEYLARAFGSLVLENARLRVENDTLTTQFAAAMKTVQDQEIEIKHLKERSRDDV